MERRTASLGGGLTALAAAVIIFWGVRSLAFILAPLAMAMVITIAILPLPGWMTKKGVKPGLALILTILAVVGVLAGVALITLYSLGKLAGYLPTYAADLSVQGVSSAGSAVLASLVGPSTAVTSTNTLAATMALTSTTGLLSQAAAQGLDLSALSSVVSPAQLTGVTTAIIVAVTKAGAQLLVVLFIFAFMLSAAFSFQGRSVAGFTSDNPRLAGLENFTTDVRQYVNIMTAINFLVAVGNTLLLAILGIPFALLWGLLSFFMGYIPSIGWWISLIPPVFIAWSQYGVGTAAFVFLSYVLINGGVQNIVQPKMMGKGLRISPLVVFVSVIVWASVLGGLGALIAVPLTMIVMKVLESAESTRWIAALMRIGSGAEGEEAGEQKQAFERLRGVTEKVRDALPFGQKEDGGGSAVAPPAPGAGAPGAA